MKPFYSFLIGLAAGAVLGGWAGARTARPQADAPPAATAVVRHDTVRVRDTVRVPVPTPVKEYVIRTVRDTVRLAAAPLTDSTALAALPLTRRVYADSTFRAVVSGYRPQLDSLAVFPVRQVVTEQVVVTRTVRKPARFSLGLQVGYGTDFRRHGPYVGIGLQWNWINVR